MNIWRQSPSGRFTSENLATNTIAKGFWEVLTIILTVVNSLHSSSADNVVLSQVHILTVQESTNSQTVESPVLEQNKTLTIQNSSHGQTLENTYLIQVYNLTVQNVINDQYSENVILYIPPISLSVNNIIHDFYSDYSELLQNYNLIVQNSEIGGGGGGGLKYWSGSQWIETSIKIYT